MPKTKESAKESDVSTRPTMANLCASPNKKETCSLPNNAQSEFPDYLVDIKRDTDERLPSNNSSRTFCERSASHSPNTGKDAIEQPHLCCDELNPPFDNSPFFNDPLEL